MKTKNNEFYSQLKIAFTSNPANMLDPYELSDKLALDIAAISGKYNPTNLTFVELIEEILNHDTSAPNPSPNPSPIPLLSLA